MDAAHPAAAARWPAPPVPVFTTRDIIYGDNPEVGERRRVTASCQMEGFDQMAGQKELRTTPADRMRFKVLHKFYDYKARFEESHMCVGCGRCTPLSGVYFDQRNGKQDESRRGRNKGRHGPERSGLL